MGNTQKFSDVLITSDFDATFFERGFIPQRNLDAIFYFMNNGGLFTLNTARPVDSIQKYLPMFGVNAPAVLCNGAVIYDYQKEKILDATFMDRCAIELAREVYSTFSNVGIELYTETGMSLVRPNQVLSDAFQKHRPKGPSVDIFTFNEPLVRMVFIGQEEIIRQLFEFIEKKEIDQFDHIKPFGKILNFMAKGVNKGAGLIKLNGILGMENKKTFAIGDSFNDVEMLKTADFSACPENGKETVKALCDLVVGNVMDGAVADLIEYLEDERRIK